MKRPTVMDMGNDRAPSHKKPKVPLREVAARIAAGESLEDLAIEYRRNRATMIGLLNHAGFSAHTGLPAKRGTAPLVILRPFRFPAWADRALCAQTDPEAHFPEKGQSVAEAKRTCLACEVRAECLEYALANEETHGVWGGLSPLERRRMRRAAS